MSEPTQTSLQAFLFTDIVGSTDLKRRLGDAEGARVIADHDVRFRRCVQRFAGEERNNPGDGFFATFPVPSSAVRCALAFLSDLRDSPLQVRIGIHMGETTHVPGTGQRDKLLGLAVDTAGRVMGLARADQILITRHALDSARQQVQEAPGGEAVVWRSHGAYRFKGLDESIEIHEVGIEGIAPLAAPNGSQKARRLGGSTTSLPQIQSAQDGTQFAPGDRVDGLHIEKTIGAGAYGVVFLARDELIGRPVALKVVAGEHTVDADAAREQILSEARLIGALNSPHIVTLHRVHPAPDGGWMLQMEFVGGGSLEDVLEPDKPLPLEEAVNVFRGVCLALKTAHDACVLHGDIKPANVLFGKDRLVKLADFGLARMLDPGGGPMDLFGHHFGTPRFMAPEVLTGSQAGRGSDIWSAAVLFYLCLTGRYPFAASTYGELMQAVMHGDPESMGSDVPQELSALVTRCLAKEADDRPESAAAVIAELDAFALNVLSSAGPALERQRLTNCSTAPTTFVGRAAEQKELAELLGAKDTRIVTMTGPAGIGKTRLAQELCVELAPRFAGGAWFADLSETRDADGVAHAIAAALRVELPEDEQALAALTNILQFRPPLLLVLDNFEQLTDCAVETVGAWTGAVEHVRFLVTSRALLDIAGERAYELAPLALPDLESSEPLAPEPMLEFAAIRLFVDRATEADPRFKLDPKTAPDVLKICRELDGMPLAIELAAARARVLRPSDIAKHLEKKFQLLTSTRRDLSPRQRTLAAAIEWSCDLLEPWEREAFLQSCAFRDGFSLEAAARVLDLEGFADAPFIFDVAQSLRDKSLLTATDTGYEHRLGMYRAIREYGAAKWAEEADAERQRALAERHANYYAEFAEEWNELIPGPRDQEALDRIGVELGNLAAAQEWALAEGQPTLAARTVLASARTARMRRPSRLLAERIEKSLAALAPDETALRAGLLVQLAAAGRVSGEWERALAAADEAVALADDRWLAEALLQQGEMRRSRGDMEGALAAFEECEAKAGNARHVVAASIGSRGVTLGGKGDFDGALACFEEAAKIAREVGDYPTLARHISNRGVVLESRGEPEQAIACHREAEELSRRIGNRLRIALSLGNRANLHVQTGDVDRGMRCYEEAEAIARELGAKQSIALIVGNRGSAHAVREEEAEAIACYEVSETIARELGDMRRLAFTLGKRGSMHNRRGELEAALACFEEAEQIGEQVGDPRVIALHRCQRGRLLRELGRVDEAWDALHSGLAIYDEMKANRSVWYFDFMCHFAALAKSRGDRETASRLAAESLELADELGLDENHPDIGIRESVQLARSIG